MKRPLSITIISWIFIVLAVLSIASSAITFGNEQALEIMALSPIPVGIQIAISIVGMVVTLSAGVLMLKGLGFGRHIYMGYSLLNLLIAIFTTSSFLVLIPSIVMLSVFAFFLYRAPANQYFSALSALVVEATAVEDPESVA